MALLGLARRGGHAVIGTDAVLGAARASRLRAVVIACDASENARDRIRIALARAPSIPGPERTALGAAVGRAPVAVVGVTDAAIAARLLEFAEVGDAGPGKRKER